MFDYDTNRTLGDVFNINLHFSVEVVGFMSLAIIKHDKQGFLVWLNNRDNSDYSCQSLFSLGGGIYFKPVCGTCGFAKSRETAAKAMKHVLSLCERVGVEELFILNSKGEKMLASEMAWLS